MELYKGFNSDLHTHTIASDGVLTLGELICLGEQGGLDAISITDHDSIGGYNLTGMDYFEEARRRGIELIPGIELDSEYRGVEIHILGYEIDLNNLQLNSYLNSVQDKRKARIAEMVDGVNRVIGKEIFEIDEVLVKYRETFMKPHIIHTLLRLGIFEEYRDAAKWMKANVSPKTEVPKPSIREMIELVKGAGGKAFLAHPGFYFVEHGLDIDELLKDAVDAGLYGVEVYYRYNGSSPFFDEQKAGETVKFLMNKAKEYSLVMSRGSDAHDSESFKSFIEVTF